MGIYYIFIHISLTSQIFLMGKDFLQIFWVNQFIDISCTL